MIGHQQFEKGFARGKNLFRVRADLHARFDGANTRGAEDARASVDDAEAADTDGRLALQVAESGDGNAVKTRGVKDGGARGNLDGLAVDGECDELGCVAHYGRIPTRTSSGNLAA